MPPEQQEVTFPQGDVMNPLAQAMAINAQSGQLPSASAPKAKRSNSGQRPSMSSMAGPMAMGALGGLSGGLAGPLMALGMTALMAFLNKGKGKSGGASSSTIAFPQDTTSSSIAFPQDARTPPFMPK